MKTKTISGFKIYSILMTVLFVFCLLCRAEAATGDGKEDYVRVVRGNKINKQEISDDFTFDADGDVENQIYKLTPSGTTTESQTIGNIFKNYDSGTRGGNTESTGAAIFFKDQVIYTDGGASSLLSVHRHSGSTKTTPRGVSVWGDVDSTFYVSGTQTNLFELASGNEGVSAGTTKTSPSTVEKWITIDIAGTPHYVPCYTSKTS